MVNTDSFIKISSIFKVYYSSVFHMTIEYYSDFERKIVRVVTVGRDSNQNGYPSPSLQLEGILEKENDMSIFLKNLHTFEHGYSHDILKINSAYGVISKDKIIALYLAEQPKVATEVK